MSDFLTRLASRSIGVGAVAQPSVPAMTAPAAREDGPAEVESVAMAPENDAPIQPTQRATASASRREVRHEAANAPAPSRPESPATPIPDLRVGEPVDQTMPLTGARAIRAAHETDPFAVEAPRWDATLPDPGSAAAAATVAVTPGRRQETTTPAAPIVRVSIGRVEVRAELGPAKERPALPARKSAAVSLDDYLKQRVEGRR